MTFAFEKEVTEGKKFRSEKHRMEIRWTFLEQRRQEAEKIRVKYPNRVPVVVERVKNSKLPEIDKRKFLVPDDITVAQFMWIIRKRIKLEAEQAIFIFINKSIPLASSTIGEIYALNKNSDGFLYVAYGGENTFGDSK